MSGDVYTILAEVLAIAGDVVPPELRETAIGLVASRPAPARRVQWRHDLEELPADTLGALLDTIAAELELRWRPEAAAAVRRAAELVTLREPQCLSKGERT